jgi:hypothetical protein
MKMKKYFMPLLPLVTSAAVFNPQEPKDPDKALADYTEAIRLNPNHAAAYYIRRIAYQ